MLKTTQEMQPNLQSVLTKPNIKPLFIMLVLFNLPFLNPILEMHHFVFQRVDTGCQA